MQHINKLLPTIEEIRARHIDLKEGEYICEQAHVHKGIGENGSLCPDDIPW